LVRDFHENNRSSITAQPHNHVGGRCSWYDLLFGSPLAEIRKASAKSVTQGERLSWAYTELCQTVQIVSRFSTLEFTVGAHDRFISLRQQGVRIGTQDLRIASVVMEFNGIIVTRNRRDFEQVPGLIIEDWSL
jgi:tRNA(fMet)-specific endonuclease VapC